MEIRAGVVLLMLNFSPKIRLGMLIL